MFMGMRINIGKTFLLWCVLLVFAAANFLQLRGNTYRPEMQAFKMSNEVSINDKINPNTADWTSLARLPGIGEKRAKDIIYYRNNQKKYDNSTAVYKEYTDLANVKGIGKLTCEQIRDYLIFEG